MRSHQWIEARSLALHEAVAAKLEAEPELLRVAQANLDRWLRAQPVPALREWQTLLGEAPVAEIVAILRSPSVTAARLRQSSPFAGVLPPAERRAILSRYESRLRRS